VGSYIARRVVASLPPAPITFRARRLYLAVPAHARGQGLAVRERPNTGMDQDEEPGFRGPVICSLFGEFHFFGVDLASVPFCAFSVTVASMFLGPAVLEPRIWIFWAFSCCPYYGSTPVNTP
jgi:hypothetical protein